MTFVLFFTAALLLVLVLYKLLEGRVTQLFKWLRHTNERVSSLEVKDYGQDFRMDAHDRQLGTHERRFQRMSVELKELGRDIGWGDDNRHADVIKIDPSDDDDNGRDT